MLKLRFKNCSGMTLVEILVALVILGLVLIAVLPLITQSMKVTNQAHTIASRFFSLQEEVEIIAVTKDGAYLIDGTFVPKDFFPVLLDGTTTWVPGMTVKKSKLVRFLASNLGSEYELFERYEGYTAGEAKISIEDRSIKDTSTVKVVGKDGSDVTSYLDGIPAIDGYKITITLPTDSHRFTNLNSLYTITVNTDGKELTSLLIVHLPRAIIADNNGDILITSSPEPDNWVDSVDNSNWVRKDTNFAYDINKIVFATNSSSEQSSRFIAVGNSGSIYLWENGKDWRRLSLTGVTPNLNDITATDSGGWLVVGDGGLILDSSDGLNWVKRTSGTTSNLRAVTYNKKKGKYYCVGDDGIILESSNATTWTQLHHNPMMTQATDYINSKKTVAFSGEGEYLKTLGNPITNTDNKFTVFMVVKPAQTVNTSLLTLGPPGSHVTFRTNTDSKLAVETSPDNVLTATSELVTGQPSFVAFRYDGSSVGVYKNGSKSDIAIGSLSLGGTDAPAQLGSNPLTHYTEPLPFAGSIAEVFVFDRALNTTREPRLLGGKYASEMDVVNKYLSVKYNIIPLADEEIDNLYYHGATSLNSDRLGTMDWSKWQEKILLEYKYWPLKKDPSKYSGLLLNSSVLWLDANSLTQSDGIQVTVWNDSSDINGATGATLNAVACNNNGLLYAGGDRRNMVYYDGTFISQDNQNLNSIIQKKPVQYYLEDMLFTGQRFVALLNDKHENNNYIVSLNEPGNHTHEKNILNYALNDLFHYPYGKTLLVVGEHGSIYYAKDNSADWISGNSGTTTDLLAGCLR